MFDCRGQASFYFLVPTPGAAVQFRDLARVRASQAFAKECGEEVVVTVVAPAFVERHQEEVGPLEPFEHLQPTGRAHEYLAQGAAQRLDHGGPNQGLPNILRLTGEDLIGQVVEDVAGAPPQGQIGRGSGRERVENSVVAASLKQKK